MKSKTKVYVITVSIAIFMLTLLYCTYNLNKKLKNRLSENDEIFNKYSNELIEIFESKIDRLEQLKEQSRSKSPESIYYGLLEYDGATTWSGQKWFNILSDLYRKSENSDKLNDLSFKYSNAIYYLNSNELGENKNITNKQINSLINYSKEAVQIVKELQNVAFGKP